MSGCCVKPVEKIKHLKEHSDVIIDCGTLKLALSYERDLELLLEKLWDNLSRSETSLSFYDIKLSSYASGYVVISMVPGESLLCCSFWLQVLLYLLSSCKLMSSHLVNFVNSWILCSQASIGVAQYMTLVETL